MSSGDATGWPLLRRVAWIGLLSAVTVCFAGIEWLSLLGPPGRPMGWVGLVAAIGVPLPVSLWLCRRYPAWRVFSLQAGLLAAGAAAVMLASGLDSCDSPCAPFSTLWRTWPRHEAYSWEQVLLAQLLLATGGLAAGFWPSRRSLLRPASMLGLAQVTAGLLFAESAFLGHPTFIGVSEGFVEGTQLTEDHLSGYLGEGPAVSPGQTDLEFLWLRSRMPEAFMVSIQLDEASGGRVGAVRARYCGAEDRMRFEVIEQSLGPGRARRLLERLEATGLWELDQSMVGSAGLDGSSWIFEGRSGDSEVKLDAWYPARPSSWYSAETVEALGSAYRAGRALLSESGFAVCEREIW